jgi:tRNA-dihydrouridine synthase B
VIRIGPHVLQSRVLLAPMAGVSDKPFRTLCRQFGAALAATEMLSANLQVADMKSSWLRGTHLDEEAPRTVQIAGSDPALMAQAARLNVERGAQIIDINMGCPVKKVLKQAAGSALLRDEALVQQILTAVVQAVDVPVTLKIRTGWSHEQRNGVRIARIAEDAGVKALAVHGRTRCDMFNGSAEFDTIAAIRHEIGIPLFANGDIATPEQARAVLAYTGADAVMIGRGAQGRPWIFREIQHYLDTGRQLPAPTSAQIHSILRDHVTALHDFYGSFPGIGFARKHTAWYLASFAGALEFRRSFNAAASLQEQLDLIDDFFTLQQQHEEAAA